MIKQSEPTFSTTTKVVSGTTKPTLGLAPKFKLGSGLKTPLLGGKKTFTGLKKEPQMGWIEDKFKDIVGDGVSILNDGLGDIESPTLKTDNKMSVEPTTMAFIGALLVGAYLMFKK